MQEKDIQKKILEFQLLSAGLEQIEEREKEVLNAKQEIETSLSALKEVERLTQEKEILINLGAGNFVKGILHPPKKVLTSLGAGVIVEKDIKKAIELMEERAKNMGKALEKIVSEKEAVLRRLDELREEIEKARENP